MADVGRELLAHYARVEQRLIAGIAARLRDGMDSPTWAADHARRGGAVRRWAAGVLAGAARRTATIVGGMLDAAYRRGRPGAPDAIVAPAVAGQRRVVTDRVRATHEQAARYAVDVFRSAVAAGIGLDGRGETALARRRAVQRALDRAGEQGITGFIDARGRRWSLAGYLEMVAATAAAQAQLAGTVAGLREAGHNLIHVRGGPQECAICRPWMGRVLTLDASGAGGAVLVVPADVEGGGDERRMITVRVAGSLTQARAAGLFHPRCRCRALLFRPGVTAPPRVRPDPAGERARTRLRALERSIREARQRVAGALDDTARDRATALLRTRQARLRAHVAASAPLGVRRDQRRERTDLGFRVDAR